MDVGSKRSTLRWGLEQNEKTGFNPVKNWSYMEAIRETQTVKDGQVLVHLPRQFWGKQVEIIVRPAPPEQPTARKTSLRGCLHQYANSALISRESEAWQEAVREKYDHR